MLIESSIFRFYSFFDLLCLPLLVVLFQVYGHPSKPSSLFKLLLLIKYSNDTEYEPYINFQPEAIRNFSESKLLDDGQSGEISSIADYLLLLLKVLLEAIIEIAL